MPKSAPPRCSVRSKIWLADPSGEVVFGLGRMKILSAIERLGSIQAAARELKMSYRAIWGRIRATEARLGQPLLVRSTGGAAGGGSQLTPFAIQLLERFRRFHRAILDYSDRLLEEDYDGMFGPPGDPPPRRPER